MVPVIEDSFEFITEELIPEIDEIDAKTGYHSENISIILLLWSTAFSKLLR